ncbi:MAG: putative oxidoreductase C-terminal domain-containing protein [Kiritimatiellia bacterium]
MNKVMMACAGAAAVMICGCDEQTTETDKPCDGGDRVKIKLITIDPGHFHAALVQKRMYPDVDKTVHIYAPDGDDLAMHMERINSFNERADNPTDWNNVVYRGDDFLEKAVSEKKGNVVVLAGNNARKIDYILRCVEAGYNVLSDKPMVINPEGYEKLKKAFAIAKEKGVVLYDIMTERYEVSTALQRELSQIPGIYGQQDKGSPEDPAVTKESVHHFCKMVAGKPLRRPAWYYDTDIQGEAIVDVNTHLVDLIQWEVFPRVTLSPADVNVVKARTWDTSITPAQFEESTGLKQWPDSLKNKVENGKLMVNANGAFTYSLKGVYARSSVIWNVKAPEDAKDTHYSMMRGTRSSLIIRQGAEQDYKTALYVEPREGADPAAIEKALTDAIAGLQDEYPGIAPRKTDKGWQVVIPPALKVGHEAHFGQVTEKYLGFLQNKDMPAWEVPNMLVKYHTLMEAYRLSR